MFTILLDFWIFWTTETVGTEVGFFSGASNGKNDMFKNEMLKCSYWWKFYQNQSECLILAEAVLLWLVILHQLQVDNIRIQRHLFTLLTFLLSAGWEFVHFPDMFFQHFRRLFRGNEDLSSVTLWLNSSRRVVRLKPSGGTVRSRSPWRGVTLAGLRKQSSPRVKGARFHSFLG